uniref:Nucleobindin-1 n=1 Tax=Lygus hesperus TaxID=30085 RepID=A0A0A9X9A0_LYGHE
MEQRRQVLSKKPFIVSPILEHIHSVLQEPDRAGPPLQPSLLFLSLPGGLLDAANSVDIVLRLFQHAIENCDREQDYVLQTSMSQRTFVEVPHKPLYGSISDGWDFLTVHPYTLTYVPREPLAEQDLLHFQQLCCFLLLHYPVLSIRYLEYILTDLHIQPDTSYIVRHSTSDMFRNTSTGSYVGISSV